MYEMFRRVKPVYILVTILTLSCFTHLWNAVGFPDIFFDEGVYMGRTMHLLSGLGLQDGYFHDHPFFGQIFLAASLGLVGFPNSLNPSSDPSSISLLYLIPRIIMGLLAVLDTFLVYKIADTKYGKKVAIVSSLLFAVMPITWIMRRILLDSILMPFLLSSILLALKTRDSNNKIIPVLFSGICLGIAIFTKVPVFTMIPLVAGLVYFNAGKSARSLALWVLPVIAIPLIWPLQAIEANQFNLWLKDIIWQTQRHSEGLPYISIIFFRLDPILFSLGIFGIIFAAVKKNYFLLTWFSPFLIFLFLIGYNQYFYWIPVLPVFCIAAALLFVNLERRIKKENLKKIIPFTVLGIAAIGLVSTILIIGIDMTKTELQAASFVIQKVTDNNTTVLASPTYSWILNYVFHKENIPNDYSFILFNPIKTGKVLLVADPHLMLDLGRGKKLQQIYNDTKTIASFDEDLSKYDMDIYPYSSMRLNLDGEHIKVKIK